MARLRTQYSTVTSSAGSVVASTTAPTSPHVGLRWYNTATGVTYQWTSDGASNFWLDISSGGIGTSAARGVDFVGDTDPHLATNGTGLAVGSTYYNREKNTHFVCTNATTGANVWVGRYAGAGGDEQYTYSHGGTNYRIHVFKNNGNFCMEDASSCNALIVAGGGGGGWGNGGRAGGGGAGGLRWKTASIAAGITSVVVGKGGAGSTSGTKQGKDGGDSSAIGFTSSGGGGGSAAATNQHGRSGGSGGGTAINTSAVGTGNTPSTTSADSVPQGFSGGAGSSAWAGGGGGGAAAAGGTGSGTASGGNGGDGSSTFVGDAATTAAFLWAAKAGTNASNALTSGLGSNPGTLYIAGGGGGSTDATNTAGHGGKGGGGTSADVGAAGSIPALANTGGGGQGQKSGYGIGHGADGIVIIRYAIT